jgi:hypothetical protein
VTPRPGDLAERGLQYLRRSRVQIGLARAAATAPIRVLDPVNPDSWEFSAFSAAGEDGIIDYLTRRMRDPEHVFLEIGASDGIANNTAWLAIARKWRGVMVEADAASVRRARPTLGWFNSLVEILELLASDRNVDAVLAPLGTTSPDVFSLDIDSLDYYVARALFEHGLRPRLCVVEYNSAYGPERRCTIDPAAVARTSERLYYGVSIAAWRSFFAERGYHFVGVERTGVNAFFARRDSFDHDFLDGLRGSEFSENLSQRRGPDDTWELQFRALGNLPLIDVAPAAGDPTQVATPSQ